MINGLYKNEKTKICISTTGIAGPNGGTKLKPVGLVYIGIKVNKKIIFSKKYTKENDWTYKEKQEILYLEKLIN